MHLVRSDGELYKVRNSDHNLQKKSLIVAISHLTEPVCSSRSHVNSLLDTASHTCITVCNWKLSVKNWLRRIDSTWLCMLIINTYEVDWVIKFIKLITSFIKLLIKTNKQTQSVPIHSSILIRSDQTNFYSAALADQPRGCHGDTPKMVDSNYSSPFY